MSVKENDVIQEEKSSVNSETNNKLNDKIKLVLNLYHLCDENETNVPLLNKTYTHNIRGNLIQKITGFNKLIIPNFF